MKGLTLNHFRGYMLVNLNVRLRDLNVRPFLVSVSGQAMFSIRLSQSGFDGSESLNEFAIMI